MLGLAITLKDISFGTEFQSFEKLNTLERKYVKFKLVLNVTDASRTMRLSNRTGGRILASLHKYDLTPSSALGQCTLFTCSFRSA